MKMNALVFALALCVALVSSTFSSRQAHAIATVQVNVTGQSLGEFTLQLEDPAGNIVEEDKESDKAKGVWIWRNKRPGTYKVRTLRNGVPVGTPQTIRVLDNATNNFSTGTEGGRIRTVSSSATPGQNGVSVTGRSSMNRPGMAGMMNSNFKASLTVAQEFSDIDTNVTQNGNRNTGRSINSSNTSLRGDLRYFLGGSGSFGNLANLALANLSPYGCYVGVQGSVGLSGKDRGAKLNLHNIGGGVLDTFVDRKNLGSVTPYVGCTVASLANHQAYLNLHVGPRIQINEWTFETLESQGGGNDQKIKRTEVDVGLAIGAEMNWLLTPANVGNVRAPQMGVEAGAWVMRMPGDDFSTTTSPLNINYDVEAEAFWGFVFRLGAFMYF